MSILSAAAEILLAVPTTFKVVPVLVIPVPAITLPAPENCVNAIAVEPGVIEPFVVTTNPLSELVVPSSTNTNAPAETSAALSKSVALVGAPLAFTV